ncbi:hypothetical protein NDU88_005893, partial [Pleurodeles waltl]
KPLGTGDFFFAPMSRRGSDPIGKGRSRGGRGLGGGGQIYFRPFLPPLGPAELEAKIH